MSNAPKIRFDKFSEDWDRRDFNSTFKILQNNTLSRAELAPEKGAALNVHYGDILVKFGEVLDLQKEALPYIESEQIAEKFKSSYLHDGDIIIADTAEDETAGKCTEMANLGDVPVISGLHTIPLRPQQNFATGFLGYYLNSYAYHDTLLPFMQGTKVLSISKSALQGTNIRYPIEYREQKKIGDYLRNLDNFIILNNCRLEKLVLLKAACLDKMFPKSGCDLPEVRFEGFIEKWKPYKIKEVADRYDNLRIPVAANLRIPGTTPYYGANGIQDYVDGFTHEGEFVLVAEDGANDLKNYPVQYVQGKIWVNNHAHVLQSKPGIANNPFLAYAINRANIESFLVGGGRAKLNAETLMDIKIVMPGVEEQQKIGLYLNRVETLITLQKRKVEKLKQLKQSMIHNMFV